MHKFNGNDVDDAIGKLLHVHGTLDNGLVMGVNDSSQIKNEKLANCEFSGCLIKKILNSNSGNLNEENAIQIILNSNIIVTFGLSIGYTDKNWWIQMLRWLNSRNDNILIINVYKKNMQNYINPQRIGKFNREIFESLEEICGFKISSDLRNRILIYYNKNETTFKFDLLKKR